MLTLGPCINNDATIWKLLVMNGRGEGNEREPRSFLSPSLLPCQSVGRRSLSTLELECLSFTHQTICFIRFIFSPSDPAQPDRALMMKRRGHPCIISELGCMRACMCVHVYMRGRARVRLCALPQQCNFRALAQTVMPTAHLTLTTCAAPRAAVILHFSLFLNLLVSLALLLYFPPSVLLSHSQNCQRKWTRKGQIRKKLLLNTLGFFTERKLVKGNIKFKPWDARQYPSITLMEGEKWELVCRLLEGRRWDDNRSFSQGVFSICRKSGYCLDAGK